MSTVIQFTIFKSYSRNFYFLNIGTTQIHIIFLYNQLPVYVYVQNSVSSLLNVHILPHAKSFAQHFLLAPPAKRYLCCINMLWDLSNLFLSSQMTKLTSDIASLSALFFRISSFSLAKLYMVTFSYWMKKSEKHSLITFAKLLFYVKSHALFNFLLVTVV